ncbi:MAG: alpha/beta hydrolase [Gemmatimonadaceae bacterium]|nr:alpha/beta hydrolase [Gemmatimonadaceae bacterium]
MSDVTAVTDFVHVHVPPAPESAETRTILLLHGTGGDERDLLQLGGMVAPGARLLGVRGQVLEGGMPRFFRRLSEGVFDEADVTRRAADLAAYVPVAAAHYGFDARGVVALGFSNGANIAAAMLLLHPGALAAAALLRSMVPLEPAVLPALAGTPVLLAEGRFDPIIPPANAERLAAMLQASGAAVTLHWEPAAHGLTQADVVVTRDWLAATR